MKRLNDFDRDVLSVFAQHMPYEDVLTFAVYCVAEVRKRVEREALNASLLRLCRKNLLRFDGKTLHVSDEVKLAARGRLWQKEAWKERFFPELEERTAEEASGQELPAEFISAEQFRKVKKLAGKVRNLLHRGEEGMTARQRARTAVLSFLALGFSALFAWLAVHSALISDYDNTFAAIASFLFFPAAAVGFGVWLSSYGGQDKPHKGVKRAVKAAIALSCALHAAFFAVLIPKAAYHAAGLALVLAVCGVFVWLYFWQNGAGIRKKTYSVGAGAFTRCGQYYINGTDVLSGENRERAEGTSAALYLYDRGLEAEVYKVRGRTHSFYVAIAGYRGVTLIAFPRARDSAFVLTRNPLKEEDERRNGALEHALLCEYARLEREKEGNEVFSYSPDGLVRGFVCLQGEGYCARLSVPLFNMPEEQASLPEAEGVEVVPREDVPAEEVVWETLAEESFEKQENAEAFLRSVLAEADTEQMYVLLNG